jgi:Na+/H+ antiporter NhaD/arsenite permease-like protein
MVSAGAQARRLRRSPENKPAINASSIDEAFVKHSSHQQMFRTIAAAELMPHWPIMLPFVILLLAIVLGPVVAQHHWQRHYHRLCVALAGIVCVYYLIVVRQPSRVLHALLDYLSFIVIVGSPFVISGGIHLRVRSPSGPLKNSAFLFAGAVLGNLIGTIGASVLLIRPWIAMNKGRVSPMHIAFFIFLVSNIGGALLPLGSPLVLGYLKNVPFTWTLQHCWAEWLTTVAILLLVFFIWDWINHRALSRRTSQSAMLRCDGARNFFFLFALLIALIAAPVGWRELLLILIAVGSYFATSNRIRETNEFTFAPLIEVGWLFLGIFGTMIPVLDFMERSASNLGVRSEFQFYWASGLLSAVLDNAPTYLAFFATALGLHGLDINESSDVMKFISGGGRELVAISLGAAFFGALTYIGNAPNLLIKTIAEHAGTPTPRFAGYIVKYALPVLLPVLILISLLFFR